MKCWRVSLKSCRETKVLISKEQGQFPEKSICLEPGAWPCPYSIHTASPAPTRSTQLALLPRDPVQAPLSVGAGHAVPYSLHPHCFQNHLSIAFYLCSCPSSFRVLGRHQGTQVAKFNMLTPWFSHLKNGYACIISIS